MFDGHYDKGELPVLDRVLKDEKGSELPAPPALGIEEGKPRLEKVPKPLG